MDLADLTSTIQSVADKVGGAVVRIGRDRRGTGFVLADGFVVTNAHNLRDTTTSVSFADGRTVQAQVAGADNDGDLAVLRVDTAGAPAAVFSQADSPGLGEVVFAIGRSGDGVPRVTFGTVSAADRQFRGPRGRRIGGAIEHTAALARGSSGSPLVNTAGEVVAINTHRLRGGFYLARVSDQSLRARLDELSEGKSTARPRLGVALAPSHVAAKLRAATGLAEATGLLVRGVEDDSPAAEAGLKQGDLLTKVGDTGLAAPDDLYDALVSTGAGGSLTLTYLRGDTEHITDVSFPAPERAP